jgi:hypothetical protein
MLRCEYVLYSCVYIYICVCVSLSGESVAQPTTVIYILYNISCYISRAPECVVQPPHICDPLHNTASALLEEPMLTGSDKQPCFHVGQFKNLDTLPGSKTT